MDDFVTEEQRVEALHAWWRRNGAAAILVVLFALAGLLGWQYWQQRQSGAAQQASLQYDGVLAALGAGDAAQVRERGQLLRNAHPDSTYSVLAALAMARAANDAGDVAAALEQLGWVVAHAGTPELREVAHLRAARLLLGAGKLDEALAELRRSMSAGFAAEREELRGDIAFARGDMATARSAYTAAVAAAGPAATLIQLKLDNLPAVEK